MEKTKYKLRCDFNSDDLFIEFEDVSNKQNFVTCFSELIDTIDGNVLEIEQLYSQNDIMYHFESDIGTFKVSSDNFGSMVILSDKNDKVICELDRLLKSNNYFQSVEN